MNTVTAFYEALSVADGDAAAALVVPEKRGVGPFNEQSIHAFYGSLSVPLKLTSVSLRAEQTVRVRYIFVDSHGSTCDGQADVETIHEYGKTLIKKIRAFKGC